MSNIVASSISHSRLL